MRSISKSCKNYIRHGAHVNLTESHEETQHVALSTFMILPRSLSEISDRHEDVLV